ncbi:MAG: hypothetical protein IJU10_02385 [Clostridia bacterium]|nr:hypothetical protein [Clostridia bacterium]
MEKNGLLLSAGERVVKRYDFVDGEGENSLIITDNRVIRRINGGDTFSQREILLSDVNQTGTSCQTIHHYSEPRTNPLKYVFIVIAIALLAIAIYFAYSAIIAVKNGSMSIRSIVLAGICLIFAVIFLIVAFKLKKLQTHTEETVMKIDIYDKYCNNCVISIELVCGAKDFAWDLANELGSFLFSVTEEAKVSPKVATAAPLASSIPHDTAPITPVVAPAEEETLSPVFGQQEGVVARSTFGPEMDYEGEDESADISDAFSQEEPVEEETAESADERDVDVPVEESGDAEGVEDVTDENEDPNGIE